MSVLVDTSVWSLALRRKGPADHPAVDQLMALLDDESEVVLIGLILQEVLQAFRDQATFDRLENGLQGFRMLPLRRRDYVVAASLHRRCAAKGIAASSVDCLIAAAALVHGAALLTTDRDFEHIATVSSLELLGYG